MFKVIGLFLPLAFLSAFASLGQTFSPIKNISAKSQPYAENFIEYNDKFYFFINDGNYGNSLWVSDGTSSGTSKIADVKVTGWVEIMVYKNKMYFAALDSSNCANLWTSDGTQKGTFQVTHFIKGDLFNVRSAKQYLGKIYFQNYHELWISDGTEVGTHSVKIKGIVNGDDMFFFIYKSSIYVATQNKMVKNNLWQLLNEDSAILLSTNSKIMKNHLSNINDTIYFTNDDGQLCTTDLTDTGTKQITKIRHYPYSTFVQTAFVVFKNKLFFEGADNIGDGLWMSDGTESGTKLIRRITYIGYNMAYSANILEFYVGNGKLYFDAEDTIFGKEPWVSDGSSQGTIMIKDIDELPRQGSDPYLFNSYNGKLYFSAQSGNNGYELYSSDGTISGTKVIKPLSSTNFNPSPGRTFVYKGSMYFSAMFDGKGVNLWQYNDSSLSGVTPQLQVNNLFICYPNPVIDNSITLKSHSIFNNSTVVTLLDEYGGIILQKNTRVTKENCEFTLHLPEFINSGIYLLKVTDNKGTGIQKIIIQR
jgi:ELWxxDGT repeat protein